jgi:glycosyltransferase involved in cell wall biosynthesis/beta-glucosidase/6-phospho-beta-glucosidase/beta-galactosidase
MTFISGFESTHLPLHGKDSLDLTGHSKLWRDDLDSVMDSGVRHLRYPLRWQRIESERGLYDWAETDRILGYIRDNQLVAIIDLVHHTSYPDWLSGGFGDPRFGSAFVRFAEAVAHRYPWLPAYTVFNEPFATLFLAGHEGLWPPYDIGLSGFIGLLRSVLPALSTAARCWQELLPRAHHVWVDTAEHHAGTGQHATYAQLANDRRHIVLDLALGHDLDANRPFLRKLLEAGGEDLLTGVPPLRVDVLGLDYYGHSEWFYDDQGGHSPSSQPVGFAAIAEQYSERYQLPMMLTETNIRGLPTDRISWLRYMLEQYELALSRGVSLHGFCWFPHVDSSDWDSLLSRAARRVDPVGVLSRNTTVARRETCFSDAWKAAANGTRSLGLPAYRWQSPCDVQMAGFATDHWPWQDPPPAERLPPLVVQLGGPSNFPSASGAEMPPENQPDDDTGIRVTEREAMLETDNRPDLVVLSHLRWTWVWQRPQHLISRLARERGERGGRTWFVEEPMYGEVPRPRIDSADIDGVTRVWLVLPAIDDDAGAHIGFAAPAARCYGALLTAFLADAGCSARPDVWLYSPMALELAEQLAPGRLIYDVMDDLAAFSKAPEGLRLLQRRALTEADIVFTGGRSLFKGVRAHRRQGVHLFPSGVESKHYATARHMRRPRASPVAGYVGVIDERIDLQLIDQLAAALPDWTVRMIGPVAKIDPTTLPQAPNLEYAGFVTYEELPAAMGRLDVALMPFALNDATRSISPTKTLEYLAAGLPVVSTRVPDVVADFGSVVRLADDAQSFAAACRDAAHDNTTHDRQVRSILHNHEWDTIAETMTGLVERCAPWSKLGAVADDARR